MTKIRDEKLLEAFGANLRRIREEKGLSQEQVAYDADIPVNQIGRIERGEINTTISTMYSIAKALKINVKELLNFNL